MTQSFRLECHPDTPCPTIGSITVSARRPRSSAGLELEFTLAGQMASLRVPAQAEPRRVAGLWRHTCLEAFLSVEGEPCYLELNLAPSGEWAAWTFDDYRAGMRDADIPDPRIETRAGEDMLVLHAALDLSGLLPLASAEIWLAGFAAVIELRDSSLAYWALAHPPGRPDFHAAVGRCGRLQGKLGA
ncbi:MAG: DOMON-like domain-containing protein [Steroidobacteraceae bacterium]|jgi:hypothetical protein|nr:DOMON-like domain-containing protein [Steroidobacteraceae bacterium]